jgi:hypothetical protein
MKNCTLSELVQSLKPWLSNNYIRKAKIDANGHLVIDFTDGVTDIYRVDDCTAEQLSHVLKELKNKGIA